MRLAVLRIAVAFGLLIAGWSVGKAQTAVADFEIAIDVPRGDLKLICQRGCDWAKSGTPSLPTITVTCETERCRAAFNGHGRITLGIPVGGR